MNPEPLELEHRGWEALSTSGKAAAAFYDEVHAEEGMAPALHQQTLV